MKWLVVLLLFCSGCVAVETRVVRVDKDVWLASKYLEFGKEPPLIINKQMMPVSFWLALLKIIPNMAKDFLDYNRSIYYEKTRTVYFLKEKENVIPDSAFQVIR